MKPEKLVPRSRAVLCVVLCVLFSCLTTYQFCYYSLLTGHRNQLTEEIAALRNEYEKTLRAQETLIGSLEARVGEQDAELTVLRAQVDDLTARLVSITGKPDGTAEDCLRGLLQNALKKGHRYLGVSPGANLEEEVDAYMQTYADGYLKTAEQLLLIDYLYRTNYAGNLPSSEKITEAVSEAYVAAAGDVYARYYTAEEYDAFRDQMDATIRCGIGAVSTAATEGGIYICHVYAAGSAKEVGMMAGDRVTKVDGKDITALPYADAVALIAGSEGTTVTLTVVRDGAEMTFTPVRRTCEAETVLSTTYTAGEKTIGYIRLISFTARTAEQFAAAYEKLEAAGISALVLDVRDNAGGLLTAILDTLDYIVPKDTLLVRYDYRNTHNQKADYTAKTDHRIDLPIYVLQNRRTASAAELLCAVLRETRGATLIGETTYGKGVMQSGYRFESGAYITVTVAHYAPPSGKNYDGIGLSPDEAGAVALPEKWQDVSVWLLPEEEDLALHRALALCASHFDHT